MIGGKPHVQKESRETPLKDRRDRWVPTGQEVTGEKITSRPKSDKQRNFTQAVSNVPI